MTAAMKNVSAAKLATKPSGFNAATETASANHTARARPIFCHSTRSALFSRHTLETTSTPESAAIAMPYHKGKKPGPGPSGPRYSHCRAWTMM